ncbi:MAG: DNA mismatch repair endonuclease MutL [Rikenellaceae bacterium]
MLKILPSHISNLIAAGEVVQRPASVVKELMENAVDASATHIEVVVKDAGRTLIQIIDNGDGMSPQDAKTAFLRHATSKLSEIEDLDHLHTFGFRGEALASVAAVSEVVLKTRREIDPMGFEVRFAESKLIYESEVSTPKGSNFIVRNIFYNVPARRKFLKSDATEFRQIVSEFTRVAITRPDLAFKLTHNGNDIFNLPPVNLRRRIQDVAGRELGRELVDIHVDTSLINIKGYIGKPEDSKKTPGNQYFFVNNRYFRSPYFQKAVLKAYENLIQDGTLPSFFIFFEADTEKIDVNIHPSKTEIKFEDEFAIFDILRAVVRESLGKNSFMPSIDFDQEGAPEIPKVNTNYYVPTPKIDYDPLFNPFNEELTNRHFPDNGSDKEKEYNSPLIMDPVIPQKPVLLVAGKYVITTIKSGLIVINIKRARERILYEKYLDTLSQHSEIVNHSLFPKTIDLDEYSYSVIIENIEILGLLGFDIRSKEDECRKNCVEISGIPDGVSDEPEVLYELIDKLVFDLTELGRNFGEISRERFAATLAHSASSGKQQPLNNLEAQVLIDFLFACREPSCTPDGKPCTTIITLEELEKRLT